MRFRLLLSLSMLAAALIGASPGPTRAACVPVTPKPCPKCFAVMVMPDTQNYTRLMGQPERGNHLDLVTR